MKGIILDCCVKKILLAFSFCAICMISLMGNCSAEEYSYKSPYPNGYDAVVWFNFLLVAENPHDMGYKSIGELPYTWYAVKNSSGSEIDCAFTYDAASNTFTVYDLTDNAASGEYDGPPELQKHYYVRFIDDKHLIATSCRDDRFTYNGETVYMEKSDICDKHFWGHTKNGNTIWFWRSTTDGMIKYLENH